MIKRQPRHWNVVASAALLLICSPSQARGQCILEKEKLVASDGAPFDHFGGFVAASDDIAVVGAPHCSAGGTQRGAVYVFVRRDGIWVEEATLTAIDARDFDHFGSSVGIDGDTIAVAAGTRDAPNITDVGAVFVFVKASGFWAQQAELIASDGSDFDYLGYSLAIDGDTIVAGALSHDLPGKADAGSVYVFERAGAVWYRQVRLTADDSEAYDRFGWSVAIDATTIVVGSIWDRTVGGVLSGSAYVFQRTGDTWDQQAHLVPPDGSEFAAFGPVALFQDTILVGAFRDDPLGIDSGSAYVFTRQNGAWQQQAKLTPSDGSADDLFGISVAVAGDVALIGAPYSNTPNGESAGSAYMFKRSGDIWTQETRLLASDGGEFAYFGQAAAIESETAIVGATIADNRGAAYVYALVGEVYLPCDANCDGSTNGFDVEPFVSILTGEIAPCAACAGDVNGDSSVNGFDVEPFVAALLSGGC